MQAQHIVQSEVVTKTEFATIESAPVPTDSIAVIVEIRPGLTFGFSDTPNEMYESGNAMHTLLIDPTFEPVSVKPTTEDLENQMRFGRVPDNLLVKGYIPETEMEILRNQENVVEVWHDTPIAPFANPSLPYDCSSSVARGSISDVAAYLKADLIWKSGHTGEGITVAVVDGGITAKSRVVAPGETSNRIPNVTDGWPVADWGTQASKWGEHGNMCATDVLGIAPNVNIYDIRISGGNTQAVISDALAGFQWCINKFRQDGTPHIMTNSWGIYQSAWDVAYATNPNHFFTRKVVEAINEGIIVLFAAGNCGDTCPDGRCGTDTGPGKSIWGANGHSKVITVGAVNKNEEFVGYSSDGPAALDPHKPDFCSITHFHGYFPCDSGTSAATPVAAGVVALMKQKILSLTPDDTKNALIKTAKDPWNIGWNECSGAGIIQAMDAYNVI